ncbi:nucleoside 2-deoxyribosyltransferase [Robertmurraya kyonggiensis]|uniref:Group-specific protein n=1 Tax=Robertmurraya kyonggiensis TaxID=1037680 RepID=A0A4U1DBT0_9BACI|nr:nucleoside 2-deoxyribosyltransferase [Robertmurraya kyonggiensis]TKC18946.1 group-specific protein [Robertmurraya kyonggiensis]
MKKFYIASGLQNKDMVRFVSQRLKEMGFIHTYDWTQNEQAATFEELREIGQKEKNAVLESDFLIVLLPGGKGTHIEFGIALGHGKKIYLYASDNEVDNFETTSTFYHLPEVEKCFGSIEELLGKVLLSADILQ